MRIRMGALSGSSSTTALESLSSFRALSQRAMADLVRSGARAPSTFGERLRILVMLGRPRTCVVGFLTYALGLHYTHGAPSFRMAAGAVLCFFGSFLANLENTISDVDEDCQNLPGRVYLLAKLGYRQGVVHVSMLRATMLLIACALGIEALAFMALALVLVHQYSFRPLRAKARPLIGLIVFAQVVAYPFFVSALVDTDFAFLKAIGSADAPFDVRRFVAMFAFLNFWFFAKGTFKNVPDFYGDLAAGLRTSATVFGTWRRAALACTAITLVAYVSLGGLVLGGLESTRLLAALVWLGPVTWNCVRLVRAKRAAAANECLRVDMLISLGFIATVVLLVAPTWTSLITVGAGAFIAAASDLLNADSRRDGDVKAPSAPRAA